MPSLLFVKQGTEQVEGIFLNLSELEEIEFNTESFRRMNKLRLLKIFKSRRMDCRVQVTLGSGFPLNKLRYLYWDEFPMKIWPPDFHPKYLLELHVQFSRLEQLWKGNKVWLLFIYAALFSQLVKLMEANLLCKFIFVDSILKSWNSSNLVTQNIYSQPQISRGFQIWKD